MLNNDALRAWGANVDEGMERCLNNEAFYLKLVQKSMQDPSFERLAEAVSAGDLDREACMKLFKASLLGAETGGAAFGVHFALDKIVLWKRHDDDFEDCAAPERAINAFITQIIFWKDQLSSSAAGGSAGGAGLPPDFLSMSV